MKKILFFAIILYSIATQAQNVGINSTGSAPRDCAMLDILSSNKGLLIPTVALTNVATYLPLTGTAVDGLLVYSSAAPTGGNGIGYYYWNIATAAWINLVDNLAPGTPWYTGGNTGLTNPSSPATYGTTAIGAAENWMGHADAKDIVFGTDNKERMRIKQTTGFVGIGTAAPSTLFHIDGGTTSTTQTIETLTGNSLTSGIGLAITTNALTSGNAINISSSSAITGNLLLITASNASFSGNGIRSDMQGTSGATYAIHGRTSSTGGHGVRGEATATTGVNFGVSGKTSSNGGFALQGYNNSTVAMAAGGAAGVYGQSDIPDGIGIWGVDKTTANANGLSVGVLGETYSNIGIAVKGKATTATGINYGVYGTAVSASGFGLYTPDNAAVVGKMAIGTSTPVRQLEVTGSYSDYASQFRNPGVGDVMRATSTTAAVSYACLWGNNSPISDGSGNAITTSNAALQAQITGTARLYSFASMSNNSTGGNRNGGAFGIVGGGIWACNGYISSGGTYYGFYSVNGAAVLSNKVMAGASGAINSKAGFGMASHSDFMGGWIRGGIYGANIKGDRYALYTDGKTYTNDIIVQLSNNTSATERTPTYVSTSTTVDIYSHGLAKLVNGQCIITFDDNFIATTSSSIPPIVTVSPLGSSNGIYITDINKNGFTVKENGNGNSNVDVSWIAIGIKEGYEAPTVATELLKKDYDTNMSGVMHNENNNSSDALPIYWDGTDLLFRPIPNNLIPVKTAKE